MPLLVTEAAKLAIEDRQRGVIEEIIDNDEMFALLPFTHSNDLVYSYVREKTLAGGAWSAPYDDLEESASEVDPVSTQLKALIGQVDIDNFTAETRSALNDQVAIQLAMKAKGLGRQFRQAIITGDSATDPKMIDGLIKLTPAGQTIPIAANGAPVSFDALDELKAAVPLGVDALMMHTKVWLQIRGLNRAMGGNTADHITLENFGRPVKAYDGTPVIINDFIPINTAQGTNAATTSVWALRLNEADGFHGLFGGPTAGMRVEEIGKLQGKDATRWRMKWYTGAALKATHSIARLKGIAI